VIPCKPIASHSYLYSTHDRDDPTILAAHGLPLLPCSQFPNSPPALSPFHITHCHTMHTFISTQYSQPFTISARIISFTCSIPTYLNSCCHHIVVWVCVYVLYIHIHRYWTTIHEAVETQLSIAQTRQSSSFVNHQTKKVASIKNNNGSVLLSILISNKFYKQIQLPQLVADIIFVCICIYKTTTLPMVTHSKTNLFMSWSLTLNCNLLSYTPTESLELQPGMEITGIASQFAMQSRPICDASSNMRRNNCDA